ncbi:dihydrolipoyl dehydrogenase family protein [Tianweitania sp.]|uniref:dihydrolipoyl dehydrogenase family protein n=1 Tax=Tianweitania sp. TaxID=2021634 RepID=UPI0028978FB5|nr:FAD-dependent oxidoreductase [Tianweitania sp.]
MMSKLLKPDLCVIGAGSGGLTVAAAARAYGVSVVLIEQNKMGGARLNYGCVPSKALIAAARQVHDIRHANRFGIRASAPDVDFKAVHKHIRGVIDTLAPNDSEQHLLQSGAQVIHAPARFFGKDMIEAGGYTIKARRFVVASGSSPRVPPIPGLDKIDFLTNETIFERKDLPAKLVVLGGGSVGVAMAQAYQRLGSKVTLLELGRILYKQDLDVADAVVSALKSEGVDVRQNTSVTRVEKGDEGIRLHLESAGKVSVLDGSHLLVAAGRIPNISELGLNAAGIAYSPDGITVDEGLRSVTNSRVYAVGDVAGGHSTHAANYHGGLVLRPILFRLSAEVRREVVPHVIYTDPEIASVGMNEAEARGRGIEHRVLRWNMADNDRAQIEHETTGFIKVLAGKNGKILGATIVGRDAAELIHVWALALSKGLSLRDMTNYVAPYPTTGEIGKRAAVTYFQDMTRKPVLRGLLGGLRLFG